MRALAKRFLWAALVVGSFCLTEVPGQDAEDQVLPTETQQVESVVPDSMRPPTQLRSIRGATSSKAWPSSPYSLSREPEFATSAVWSSTDVWIRLREIYEALQPSETPTKDLKAIPPVEAEKKDLLDRSSYRELRKEKGYFLPLGRSLYYYDPAAPNNKYRRATPLYRSSYDRSSISLGDPARSSHGSRGGRTTTSRSRGSRR